MRTASFVFAALTLATAPVSAQVSARVLLDIPILGGNRGAVVVDRRDDPRYFVVRDYSPRNHGQWRREYRKWRPVTLYYVGGRYYERPFRNARPVAVYHYRNQYFFEPRDRDFYRERDRGRNDRDDRWDRDDRRDRESRYDRDDDRDDRDRRDGGRGQDPRYDDRARRRN